MQNLRYICLAGFALLLSGCVAGLGGEAGDVKEVREVKVATLPTLVQPTTAPPTRTASSGPTKPIATDPTTMPATGAADCPVTQPPEPPFTAPPPYSPSAPWPDNFWYGTNLLWTVVPKDGTWSGLPLNREGYTQKVLWWREGYSWKEDPTPQLTVTGRRLDGPAPPLYAPSATNAYAEDIQSAMLVGVDFPTLGCWEITGKVVDQELSFVVWIEP